SYDLIDLTIAICIGIPLGYISYRNKKLGEVLTTSSQLLRIIPSLAVLFILIPIIGVGELPALIALTFLAIPPIIMNTILGFNEIPAITLEMAQGIEMNQKHSCNRIEFPVAAPIILK